MVTYQDEKLGRPERALCKGRGVSFIFNAYLGLLVWLGIDWKDRCLRDIKSWTDAK